MRRLVAAVLLIFSTTLAVAADQMLVLKDGRQIAVARMVRRDGKVLFETTSGERFSVTEDQVAAPPLDTIPLYQAPAPSEQTLVLKDGRKIPVRKLARRGNEILLLTTNGESFSVPADDVVSPPLDTIPALAGVPTAAPPVVEPTAAATPEPTPAVTAEPTPTPAPPIVPPGVIFDPNDFKPLPDRWSIAYPTDPRFAQGHPLDPYNQNTLKGDRPIDGGSLFLVLGAIADLPVEYRRLPVGSGVSTADPERLEFFGRGSQAFTSPRLTLSGELFQGQTAFKPRSWAVKIAGAFNLNYLATHENNLVAIDVREGKTRRRQDFGFEEAFGEVKLATLSTHYDFVSARVGVQPFVSDFRGLVFSDSNLGARVFGNAGNNRWQYNAAYFDLLEKETNSELNTGGMRDQQVFIANVFRQDTFRAGYTLSASVHHSREDASIHYDANGFLVRPAKIGDVRRHQVRATYLGLAGDGHLGRWNVSHAAYFVFGTDERNPLAGRRTEIRAPMAALEVSRDHDWLRTRASFFFAAGDDDATDDRATGFDSVYDASNFAGGPFSFWGRSGIALTQTGVLLKAPGSLLPSLRSNRFEGQASFVNPGLLLANVAFDAAVTPKLRAVANLNYLSFHKTGALDLLLFQPGIRRAIGLDVGGGLLYRPALNENIVLTAGASGLVPGGGFDDLYSSACGVPGCGAEDKKLWNIFVNLKVAY